MQIVNLTPQSLWQQFAAIAQLPHPSGQLEALQSYIIKVARDHGYAVLTDAAGNVLVRRPDAKPRLCLQAHYDMVPQHDDDVPFDFAHDALQLRVVDGQVMATGTTLGADNGIGVAAMLALIADGETHRGLEFLFTADEETGMHGVHGLSRDWLQSPCLVNLDTEQEGVLMTGCAGAVNINATLKYRPDTSIPEGDRAIQLTLTGLQGGHSGMDIHLHRANACRLMNRFLKHSIVSFEARLSSFNSGTLRNAIPREATAVITVPGEIVDEVIDEVAYYEELYRDEFGADEPTLRFTAAPIAMPQCLLPEEVQDDLVNAIEACHNGVWSMGEGYVDTSSNMAHVQTSPDGEAEVLLMVRSMDEERKRACSSSIQSAFLLAGFGVDFASNYGAWNIPSDAPLVHQAQDAYRQLSADAATAQQLRTDKVHCGLECGVLTELYPDLQIISVGPTIHHPHSPQESVEIESVQRFWQLLKALIALYS